MDEARQAYRATFEGHYNVVVLCEKVQIYNIIILCWLA